MGGLPDGTDVVLALGLSRLLGPEQLQGLGGCDDVRDVPERRRRDELLLSN